MKIDTQYLVPKRKLNYWGMLGLIICFLVSCGTLEKGGHKAPVAVVTEVVPVINKEGNNKVVADTIKKSTQAKSAPLESPTAIVAPIKSEIQKLSENASNGNQTLDSLKKILYNQNQALNRQTEQGKTIAQLSATIIRANGKIDSLFMALTEEKELRAKEKRSAEIRETGNKTLVTLGTYFPLFAGCLMMGAGMFGYWLRGRKRGSFIQFI